MNRSVEGMRKQEDKGKEQQTTSPEKGKWKQDKQTEGKQCRSKNEKLETSETKSKEAKTFTLTYHYMILLILYVPFTFCSFAGCH